MYFCYIDESGDTGAFDIRKPENSGSAYFILSGLIVPAKNWKESLNLLKSFRKKIASQGYLKYDTEFHCSELIDPHKIKEYTTVSIKERWWLIEEFASTIGGYGPFSIITVVIDKTVSKMQPSNYLHECMKQMYLAFDEFLKEKEANGMLFFDRASERSVTTFARKLMNIGNDTIPGVRIGWIIEDPIFRISSDSIFIQAADVIAYCLKEKEFPKASRKKFNADKIFGKLNSRCFKSRLADEDSIIRI